MDQSEVTRVAAAIFRMPEPEWKRKIICNDKGAPKALLANAELLFRHAEEMQGVLAFNEFSLEIIALKPTPWGSTGRWTDDDSTQSAVWLQRTHGVHVSSLVASEAALTVARQQRSFHPVREYLDGLKWDGVERIDQWLPLYLGTENTEYTRAVGQRWLISAVARIYRAGSKVDCCLILEGEQGIKKSTALRTIAGDWFTDEISDLGSKDAAMQTRGVWLIEIAELDSMSRTEVGRVKAFMSRSVDRFRPPYGRSVVESPRQCVFAGSVNHSTYLRDETGGRRFWPVACTTIHKDELARDRDQLWAEAVAKYRAGAVWWLDSLALTKAAEQEQAARYVNDPWEERLVKYLDGKESASVGEFLAFLGKPEGQWTRADEMRVSACFRALSWDRYKARFGEQRQWRYRSSTGGNR